MIKQIICKEIKNYLKNNTNRVLLDVRTQEEWDNDGKPDGDKIGLRTYFLEIQRNVLFDFVQEFQNLNINQDKEILVICKSGERSQISAELLSKENYKSINILMVLWAVKRVMVGKKVAYRVYNHLGQGSPFSVKNFLLNNLLRYISDLSHKIVTMV